MPARLNGCKNIGRYLNTIFEYAKQLLPQIGPSNTMVVPGRDAGGVYARFYFVLLLLIYGLFGLGD